ncbi:hypothetical protein C8035_v000658 [Colletotrichum spinosum]|uniref:Uncharacterized protein n=1 Tax=Colletotrichum spinosum TaxID=1347390 RepID=A0A4R8Q607_9PEZI|nr:hypothetical protein C8035_v000658 [Colletotrichum spinosum]
MKKMFVCCRKAPPPPPPRPRCIYANCTRRALKCDLRKPGRPTMHSLYCKDHACRQRLDDVMCPNPKHCGMNRFCDDHMRCHAQSCLDPRVLADTNQEWPYCQRRTQTSLLAHLLDTILTTADTCLYPHCHQKRSPGSQNCTAHTMLCLVPSCGQQITGRGTFCESHSCVDDDCHKVISAGVWCTDHRLCKKEGCQSARAVSSGGKHEELCWQHLPTCCGEPGCETMTTGNRFCNTHECLYPHCHDPKDNLKDSARVYCLRHTCAHASCPQPTANPSSSKARFCITHTCANPSCYHPSSSSSSSSPEAKHCALHACLHPSCPSPRNGDPLASAGVQFCPTHECHAPSCLAPARPGSSYCGAAHSCGMPTCPAPRAAETPGGVFCQVHASAARADDVANWEVRAYPPPPPPPPAPVMPLADVVLPPLEGGPPLYPLDAAEEALGIRLRMEKRQKDAEERAERERRLYEAAIRRREGGRGYEAGYGGGAPSDSDDTNMTVIT